MTAFSLLRVILLGRRPKSSKCMVDSESRKPILRKDRRSKSGVLFYGILISLLLFFLSLFKPALADFLHYRFYDILLSANRGESSSIPVIVDIDEKSLRQYGQWPWPRYRIATLIDRLR